ncbi:RusA family crossover junction endodeoxyribonuclease [Rothia terrae]|uniref:RusA family crossover junction endodeoxyribonuclease n=1 Tax=Rothia terrae TaxID=396015 RepID=UPI003824D0F7
MKEVRTYVPGVPIPQGSKTAFVKNDGKAGMREANGKLKAWRDAIIWKTAKHRGSFGVHVPVELTCIFVFTRAKSNKDTHHVIKPDLDKLTRAVGDALTLAGVYADDAQVTRFGADHGKYYTDQVNLAPGLYVTLKEIQ